jgi:hypothetical protein
MSKRLSFKFRNTTKTGLSTGNPILKNVEIGNTIHFSENKLPLQKSLENRATTLFVPKSYPEFDFFVWNADEQVLMAFQVTVTKPFTSHPKIDGTSDNCKLWLNFCFKDSAQKPMEVYWITSSCVGNPENFEGSRIIIFDELYEDFPALEKIDSFEKFWSSQISFCLHCILFTYRKYS